MGSAAAATLISACATTPIGKASNPDLEIFDAEAHSLLDIFARLEVLASGYTWSEGPVWDRARNCLYFTDVPENIAWKWSEASGATEFLAPSGVAREQATGFREPGANGLA
ncbi:MAG TPA: gluconolactonase, partial [Hyphomonas sp.]|nr:gluconolactonase [Hyphomonas sp.]